MHALPFISEQHDPQTSYKKRRRRRNHCKMFVIILAASTLSQTLTEGDGFRFGGISYSSPLSHVLFSVSKRVLLARESSDDENDEFVETTPLSSIFRNDLSTPQKDASVENDLFEGLSMTRSRAISALSQPKNSLSSQQPRKEDGSRGFSPKGKKTRGRNRSSGDKLNNRSMRRNGNLERKVEERKGVEISSLLPPAKQKRKGYSKSTSGPQRLSTWEDFLGTNPSGTNDTTTRNDRKNRNSGTSRWVNLKSDSKSRRPSISDLFPPDLLTSKELDQASAKSDSSPRRTPSMVGVLPVSDLFYRSSQSINEDDNAEYDNYDTESRRGDDEELPFSAEQTDQLTTPQNKIKFRRNKANRLGLYDPSSTPGPSTSKTKSSGSSRRLVRRGIEMLVGGVPINADPPQRCVELFYQYKTDHPIDWSHVITTDTRDFGPIFHKDSVTKMSRKEKGLFCEFFVNSTLKWNICPKDLRSLARRYDTDKDFSERKGKNGTKDSASILKDRTTWAVSQEDGMDDVIADDSSQVLGTMKDLDLLSDSDSELMGELVFSIGVSKEELASCDRSSEQSILEGVLARGILGSTDYTGFEVVFTKLLLSDLGDGTTMISADFNISLPDSEHMDFADLRKKYQRINTSLARAMDDGNMQLSMASAAKEETAWPEDLRSRVVEEFLFDDDEDIPVGDDEVGIEDLDFPSDSKKVISVAPLDPSVAKTSYKIVGFGDDVENSLKTGPFFNGEDLSLGGLGDGVVWNYAAKNEPNAPYRGRFGLRLVDAVVEKSKQRHPRVIAIGDVHGCIDELQDLLRECDYRPGDMVVFLGDLVSKGPDSVAVVQMAREIGAIGVRGNHDFETVRWHQAIKAGVDPPIAVSEHFHIANSLSNADMKWMYSLPWYISSPDLGALFVHAGFVSGIRLSKQNPRLMMNMRSILPDGTVTSKFFNNWPWARLWDGPQTVLFGHDADRGLQQYEHAIGLDTGCVYGGRLTACILPEKRLVSVSARRSYFKYRRKHYD